METLAASQLPEPIHLCLGVEKALLAAAEGQNGFSGNCAKVAVILNEVLEGDDAYVVVTGEHYEYADHVFRHS